MLKTNTTIRKINLENNKKIDHKKLKEIEEVLRLHARDRLKANCQSLSHVLLHQNGIFKEPTVVPPDVLKQILFFTEDLSEEHARPIFDKHLKA